MAYRNTLIVTAVVAMLVIGGTGVATAHDWQTEVELGDKVLGVNSAPEDPIAGMETEFSGSITDNAAEEGQENRTSWGGVTNKEAEVHIHGPNDVHDHVTAHIPEDDSHFHFAYVFPEAGTYTITVVTTIDGEEYAFEFEREVGMLPARAEGEMVERIDENVEHVEEGVHGVDEQVAELSEQVSNLSKQVESLQEQNEELSTALEQMNEANANDEESDDSSANGLGAAFGLGVGVAALLGGAALVVRRRF